MSSARFKIGGSAFALGGYDALAGAVVALQLEDSPATDIGKCVYSVVRSTKGAGVPSLAGAGVASPVTSAVNLTLPSGVASFEVQCQTNDGAAVMVNGRPDYSVNTKSRIVSVRGPVSGLRKAVIGESSQYDPTFGWFGAQNEAVDAAEGGGGIALLPTSTVITTDAATAVAAATVDVASGYKALVRIDLDGVCTAGADAGKTYSARLMIVVENVAGSMTIYALTTGATQALLDRLTGTVGFSSGDSTFASPTATLKVKGKAAMTIHWWMTPAVLRLAPLAG